MVVGNRFLMTHKNIFPYIPKYCHSRMLERLFVICRDFIANCNFVETSALHVLQGNDSMTLWYPSSITVPVGFHFLIGSTTYSSE